MALGGQPSPLTPPSRNNGVPSSDEEDGVVTIQRTGNGQDVQMARRHMEGCRTSLLVREINADQTTGRCHRTPVRVAKMNKSGGYRCWRGCGEMGTLVHCWWECKLVQPLWKTVWRFLKKLKIELHYHPAIVLLGIYPQDTGVLFRRDTCTPMFIAALSTIAKVWKEPKCPSTDEWIK